MIVKRAAVLRDLPFRPMAGAVYARRFLGSQVQEHVQASCIHLSENFTQTGFDPLWLIWNQSNAEINSFKKQVVKMTLLYVDVVWHIPCSTLVVA